MPCSLALSEAHDCALLLSEISTNTLGTKCLMDIKEERGNKYPNAGSVLVFFNQYIKVQMDYLQNSVNDSNMTHLFNKCYFQYNSSKHLETILLCTVQALFPPHFIKP